MNIFCEFCMETNNKPLRSRYIYLLDSDDMEDVGFDEQKKKCCTRRCKILVITIFGILLILAFIFVFVVIPVIFMTSTFVQQSLIFTHFGLPHSEKYFQEYKFPAFRNKYVSINWEGGTNKSLGVWHILPVDLAQKALHDPKFDYETSLFNSSFGVLIYFHGTGEARSYSTRKYQLLSYYFHVITFDYRDYADSSPGTLSEDAVINDCVQLYGWVKNRTQSPVYVWGHSLGSALATRTVASLEKSGIHTYGLILESAFTNLRDELYVHPFGKIFAWLPWFSVTILDPLERNGFIFNTSSNILEVTCPIMILHAQDDPEVPCKFGRQLYEIASKRSPRANDTIVYHEFDADLDYDHIYIYQDPFLKYYIMDFMAIAANQSNML